MGFFGSSEENIERKTVDTNGNINNNILIREADDTHHQMILSEKLLFATYLLVGAEVIKLIIYAFSSAKRMMKKKYAANGRNTA